MLFLLCLLFRLLLTVYKRISDVAIQALVKKMEMVYLTYNRFTEPDKRPTNQSMQVNIST